MFEKSPQITVCSIRCRHWEEFPPNFDDPIKTLEREASLSIFGNRRSHGISRNSERGEVALLRFAAGRKDSILIFTSQLDAVCEVRGP